MIIRTEVHARAGLLGNPSDMFGGKVLSVLIEDFAAHVRLWESPHLVLTLHPEHDRNEFDDLADLVDSVRRHGYYGMQRVLFATCRRFADYCRERNIRLRKANFAVEYETNIPRQSGLGGSSAVIIALLRALLRFHRVPAPMVPPRKLAELALSVETRELGIAAGLQDRIVQSYGGMTYMDFSGAKGKYTRLSSRWMPRLGLAYLAEEHFGTLESGQVHSQVRSRWQRGEIEVKRAMRQLARCAAAGRTALAAHDKSALGRLMNKNFELRRGVFGDDVLGKHNIELVEIAREFGLAAKLPGSSGAALILLTDEDAEREMADTYAARGYSFRPIRVM